MEGTWINVKLTPKILQKKKDHRYFNSYFIYLRRVAHHVVLKQVVQQRSSGLSTMECTLPGSRSTLKDRPIGKPSTILFNFYQRK